MQSSQSLIVGQLSPERLRDVVDDLKRDDPLAPVTVVGPSNYANLSLRHDFARVGFVNVRFMVFSRLAEFLGAPRMASEGRAPLTRVIENAAVRSAASEAVGPLGDLREHSSTLRSLKQAFRGLRYVSSTALDALAGAGVLQAETVRLYRQFRLDTAEFYDDEDLARAAAVSVDDQPTAGFEDIGAIVFYLPRDLTPGQVALIDALARRQRCVVMLGLTDDPAANEPLDGLAKRLSPFLRASQIDVVNPLPEGADRSVYLADRHSREGGNPGAGAVLRQAQDERIDGLPAPVSPEGEKADTHLLVASDPHQEIRWIIRQIVSRAHDGMPFGRMAVLYRKSDYGKIIAEEMDLAGIPIAGPDRTTLAETAVGRTLVGLMELADSDLRRGQVASWLTGCPVRSPSREIRLNPSRWDKLSKEVGIVRGIEQWRDRLDKYAAGLEESISDPEKAEEMSEGRLRSMSSQAKSARDMLAFIGHLHDDIQPPNEGASWADFSAWARRLVDDYVSRGTGTPEHELDALERVQDILSELTAAGAVAPDPTLQVFREDLYEALQASAGRLGEMGRGVFVARFRDAAGMRFDAVYMVGMIEGAVPPALGDDPLVPESARHRAGGSSAGFDMPQDARARERLDYLYALDSAPDRTLSVSLADLSAGREQHASRWLLEQAAKLSGARVTASELQRMGGSDWLTVVPSAESGLLDGAAIDASDLLDYDLRHLVRWERAGQRVSQHPFATGTILSRTLELGRARNSRDFTQWDGNGSSVARESSYASYTLNRALSPTRLERWAACPFSYFLGNVLRIGSIETPEDVFSISALERGSLIHNILDEFMRRVAESGTMPQPHEAWSADHRAVLMKVAHERFSKAEADGVTGRPVMWELERAQVLADLDTFLERDDAHRARFEVTPKEFEVKFGLPEGHWQEAVWSLDDGERVRFRGIIDRVDVSSDGRTALVIDYKTGSSWQYNGLENDPTDKGKKLQLGVYALAAQRGLANVDNVSSAYWFVTTRGSFALAPKEPVDGSSDEVRNRLGEVVTSIVSGIRSGVFPANPGERTRFGFNNCAFCDFDSLCPSRRDRTWESKRDDPLLSGYRDLVGE
ncbi:MAG: PD-(D/E)XK nuclease family protein [Dehalococcoidia bacterium]|nr:PD-(D/E)XK nuclease family protein [Dehalococcoidia bacterium]